ncbi:hypothetical protein [Sphingomonas sp.]|uniref:hypothetical protein n=1 Tax=Sphingomonas sp. TaxID=28214 RepID=UPI0035BC7B99
MTPTTIAAAALALSTAAGFATAASAAARPGEVPITATYQTSDQRYCIRPATLEEAAATSTGIYQRRCMSARQWKTRGVRFAPPPQTTLARM